MKFIYIYLILLLFLIIPQINYLEYVQSTISTKFIFFLYGCLVLLGFYSFNIVFNKGISFSFVKLDISLFLLLGYIILNRYVIQSHFGFSIRYLELVGLSFLYVFLRNITSENYIWILLAIVVSGIIQAIYGNSQLLGYYPSNHSVFKITGSFFNPGPYAGFLTAVYPIALGIYLFKTQLVTNLQMQFANKVKLLNTLIFYIIEYIPVIGIVTIILVLPASRSRAAWLSVIISTAFLLECRYGVLKLVFSKISKVKKASLITLSIVILSIGFYSLYHLKKGSSEGRLFIWDITTKIIKDNAITGVGLDRFKAYYMNYQAKYFIDNGETEEALVADNTYYAFNDFLQFATEQGLVGVLLLVVIIFFILKIKATEEQLPILQLILAGLIAITVFACFSYPIQILPIKLILILLLAFLGKLDNKKWLYSIHTVKKNDLFIYRVVGSTLLLFVLINGIIYVNKIDKAYKNWQRALTIYQKEDYEGALKVYAKVYPILKKEGDFLMHYGKSLCMAKKYNEAVIVLEEAKQHLNTTIIETALGDVYMGLKEYDKAEEAYQNAAGMTPIRFYPLYLLVKLYEKSGKRTKAVTMAKTILNKDIKIPSLAIKEIKAEMKIMLDKE